MKCIMDPNDFSKVHEKYYISEIKNVNGFNNIEYDDTNLELLNVQNFKFIVHKNDTCVADTLRSGILFEKCIVTYIRHFIN